MNYYVDDEEPWRGFASLWFVALALALAHVKLEWV